MLTADILENVKLAQAILWDKHEEADRNAALFRGAAQQIAGAKRDAYGDALEMLAAIIGKAWDDEILKEHEGFRRKLDKQRNRDVHP